MDKLITVVIGTLLSGFAFSATVFLIGLFFPIFMWLALVLFIFGAAVGAYNTITE